MRRVSLLCTALLCLLNLQAALSDTIHLPQQSRIRHYVVSYDTQGQSIWGPGQGAFNEDYAFDLSKSFDLPVFGDEIEPIPFSDLALGAFVGVHVDASAGVRFHTDANIGSVDVHCPIDVFITYPDPATLHPGETFDIQTSYVVNATARMNTHSPNFHAVLVGEGSAGLSVHAKAVAGVTLFDLNLIGPYNLSLQHDLFNSETQIQQGEGDFVIVPGILSGNIHRPLLDNTVGRDPSKRLISDKSDDFFSLKGDVTNLITTALGVGAWEGPYGGSVYGGNFQVLDLYGQFDLGVNQICTFQPAPIITFRTSDGQTVQVTAGHAATLKLPASAILTVTPTIRPDNTFNSQSKLTLTPSIDFEPLHITGAGHAFGFDIFPFDIHPFGKPFSIKDTVDLPLDGADFELAGVQDQVEDATTIDATGNPLQLVEITPQSTLVSEKDLVLSGKARGYVNGITHMIVNGHGLQPLTVHFNQGTFTVTIPCFYLTSSGVLALTLVTPALVGTSEKISNTVDLLVQALTMMPSNVGDIQTHQDKQIEKLPTIGNGPLNIRVQTTRFHAGPSLCPPPAFIGGNAQLQWNHVPVPTQIQSVALDSTNGTDTEYILTAQVPEGLLIDGGNQALSLVNPGPEAESSLLATVTVAFPLPTLREFSIVNDPHGGPKRRLVNLLGSLFTPSSAVTWDGKPLTTHFVSSRQLLAEITADDLAQPGKHAVVVGNPSPSGGLSGALYQYVPIPIPLSVTASHNLYRDKTRLDRIDDMIVLTNVGTEALKQIEILKVQVRLNGDKDSDDRRADERRKVTVSPSLLPYTGPGDRHAVTVSFRAGPRLSGKTATMHLVCKANGVTFTLEEPFTIP